MFHCTRLLCTGDMSPKLGIQSKKQQPVVSADISVLASTWWFIFKLAGGHRNRASLNLCLLMDNFAQMSATLWVKCMWGDELFLSNPSSSWWHARWLFVPSVQHTGSCCGLTSQLQISVVCGLTQTKCSYHNDFASSSCRILIYSSHCLSKMRSWE